MNVPIKPVTSWLTLSGALRSQFRLILVFVACTAGIGSAGAVERVSVRPGGIQGNGPSSGPAASHLARCVAFYSDATNLLPRREDSNAARDVFLFRSDGGLERVSIASDGSQANGASQAQGFRPAIDAECTCVAFSSDATNLVGGDTNGKADVFVRELVAGTTDRVSAGADGEGNGASSFPSVDADCGIVAFQSTASNLVAADTNAASDIFISTRATGAIARISVGAGGAQANGASVTPGISADGRCVAFASSATNLWSADTNGVPDIYVACDGVVTCRASVDSDGNEANGISFLPELSADGNLVVFKSLASNLVPGDLNGAADVFVHNCATGQTERVSVGSVGQEGTDNSFPASISDDGRFVAFGSFASNLVLGRGTHGYAQIYVRDREQGTTVLVSRNPSGSAGNGSAPDLPPSISPDGNWVAFASSASDLVPGDTAGFMDAFAGTPACESDSDCPGNAKCVDGECVPPECVDDADCPPGQVCTVDGKCATPTPTASPTATSSPTLTPLPGPCPETPCPPGQVCINGVCVCARRECTSDDECQVACAGEQDCGAFDANGCPLLQEPPDRTCVEGECCPADRCRSMRCVPPRFCEDAGGCFATEACIENLAAACNDGGRVCECGGDCNIDGVVFGGEISTAINILAGVAPLSVCRAADINGDGQVTGNEISLALSNLGQGCPDLLTPLQGLGQSRSGDVVTFELGSAEGAPGQTVDVGVSVRGGGGELVMAQLDLVFDPSVLTLSDPETGCRLDGRLSRQVLKVSYPDSPPAPPGRQRLRLFVGDLVLPVDAFADGPVLSCTFAINANAPAGVVDLSAEQPNASDVTAGSFGTDWAPGSVVVSVPLVRPTEAAEPPATATPVPPAPPTVPRRECAKAADCSSGRRQACVDQLCECAGDCNGDGSTVVTELVTAVRILVGQLPLSACRAADANGSGGVSIDEVLLGLNNLSRGCP